MSQMLININTFDIIETLFQCIAVDTDIGLFVRCLSIVYSTIIQFGKFIPGVTTCTQTLKKMVPTKGTEILAKDEYTPLTLLLQQQWNT